MSMTCVNDATQQYKTKQPPLGNHHITTRAASHYVTIHSPKEVTMLCQWKMSIEKRQLPASSPRFAMLCLTEENYSTAYTQWIVQSYQNSNPFFRASQYLVKRRRLPVLIIFKCRSGLESSHFFLLFHFRVLVLGVVESRVNVAYLPQRMS